MPDTPIAEAASSPYNPRMEDRVARLEQDMGDVKSLLGQMMPMLVRIDTMLTSTLPHLATKTEVAELRVELKQDMHDLRVELKGEIADLRTEMKGEVVGARSEAKADTATLRTEIAALRVEIADKPSKTYLWVVMAALVASYGVGLAALAVVRH